MWTLYCSSSNIYHRCHAGSLLLYWSSDGSLLLTWVGVPTWCWSFQRWDGGRKLIQERYLTAIILVFRYLLGQCIRTRMDANVKAWPIIDCANYSVCRCFIVIWFSSIFHRLDQRSLTFVPPWTERRACRVQLLLDCLFLSLGRSRFRGFISCLNIWVTWVA